MLDEEARNMRVAEHPDHGVDVAEAPQVSEAIEKLQKFVRNLTPEQVQPLRERVLIERIPAFEMTRGGLHLPTDAQRVQNIGVVRAVSGDIEDLVPGDIVMVEQYGGNELDFFSSNFILLSPNFVMAKLGTEE